MTHYKFIPQKILLPPPPLPPQGWALGSGLPPLAPALPALGLDLLWWSVAGRGGQDSTNKKTSRKKSDLMLGRGLGGVGSTGAAPSSFLGFGRVSGRGDGAPGGIQPAELPVFALVLVGRLQNLGGKGERNQ